MELAALPSRDPAARAQLAEVAGHVRPVLLARDRTLAVTGPLGDLLPEGLIRGSALVVEGDVGTGATSAALSLCAAATAAGEWAAAVDLDGSFSGEAAAEAGVALERFAVVRRVPPARWATVIATLLDGVSLVLAEVPRHARPADAHRLVARARERDVVLVPLVGPRAHWPAPATRRIHADGGPWPGLGVGHGLLGSRPPRIQIVDHGTLGRERVGVLAG